MYSHSEIKQLLPEETIHQIFPFSGGIKVLTKTGKTNKIFVRK